MIDFGDKNALMWILTHCRITKQLTTNEIMHNVFYASAIEVGGSTSTFESVLECFDEHFGPIWDETMCENLIFGPAKGPKPELTSLRRN